MSFFNDCISAINEIDKAYSDFENAFNAHQKIIVLGNGGSNAIASHMSQDFVKRAGKKSLSFSDPSMLTCFMNDYGVDIAYQKFLEAHADQETLVILISSSGNSLNIVKCVEYCETNNIPYGILTAFDENNKVRTTSKNPKFDYYINTHSYGVAECVHQIFLHSIVE